MTPRAMYDVMRQLPEFKVKEKEVIAAGIATIEARKALSERIASFLLQSMPSAELQSLDDLSAQVLEQLNKLQDLLSQEEEEILRKTERMTAIEQNPEKKSLLTKASNMVKEGWETAKNHKWKILFALAAIAGGVAVWYYWDYLALLFGKAGFGPVGAAETGVAGGAEVAAEGATQAEAVGAAVENFLKESAFHAKHFAVVDHDLLYKGVKYSLDIPQDAEKIAVILKEIGSDPGAIIRVLMSKTARASTESQFLQLMQQNLPKAVLSNNENPFLSTFIEDMAEGIPQNIIP